MVREHGRPTLREVADEAGVSTATVSNVINGTGRVSAATHDRVITAARRLSYQPTNSVRALRTGGSGVLGLTLTTFGDESVAYTEIPYYADLVLAAIGAANDHGYLLQVMPSTLSPWLWMTAPLDGVIHSEPRATDSVRAILLQREIPIVYAGLPLDSGPGDAWVDCDLRLAVELLVEQFVAAGARRIGYLMPQHNDAYPQLVLNAFTEFLPGSRSRATRRGLRTGPPLRRVGTGSGPQDFWRGRAARCVFGIYSDSGHNTLEEAHEHVVAACRPVYWFAASARTTPMRSPARRGPAVSASATLRRRGSGRSARRPDRRATRYSAPPHRVTGPVHARASSTGLAHSER